MNTQSQIPLYSLAEKRLKITLSFFFVAFFTYGVILWSHDENAVGIDRLVKFIRNLSPAIPIIITLAVLLDRILQGVEMMLFRMYREVMEAMLDERLVKIKKELKKGMKKTLAKEMVKIQQQYKEDMIKATEQARAEGKAEAYAKLRVKPPRRVTAASHAFDDTYGKVHHN